MAGQSSAAIFALATALAGAASPAVEETGVVEEILASHPEWFAKVVERADEHRLQILYTEIDRDEENRPSFRSHGYRLTRTRYFYPASTVKLPVAALALETLNDLARPGLGRDSPFLVEGPGDDRSTVARDVRRIFLVSDNHAFNRLYELVGQQAINERLWEMGFGDARILRRLEAGLDPEENRVTRPVVFFGRDGTVIHRQPGARNPQAWHVEMDEVRQGRGYYRDGELVEEAFDFRHSSFLSVETLQGVLRVVLFPESVPEERRFRLGEEDYRLLYRAMSMLPRESEDPAYPDRETHYDSYVKFFLFGDSRARIPARIRVFNKVGQAYGYLIDNALVVDFETGVEFLLTAVIQVNANGIYNDDSYEYDEIGFPFLARLGRAVYERELARQRPRRPDLSRLAVVP